MRWAPLAAALLSGCYGCDSALTYAVLVSVEDPDGSAVDAEVRASSESGSFDCDRQKTGLYNCSGSGRVRVEVELDGDVQSMDFDIESTRCSIIGQSATFVVQP